MSYLINIGLRICIFTILGIGANIVVGNSGLLLLCEGAFFAIGAYICAFILIGLSLNFAIALLAAFLANIVVALVVMRPALRLRGDSFALATIGIQMIIVSLLINWVKLTNGSSGITGIPDPSIGSWGAEIRLQLFIFAVFFCTVVGLIAKRLRSLPYGRSLEALRDDEIAAMSLGKNPIFFLSTAVIISAGILGTAGAFYAVYATYIDPMTFGLDQSIKILAAIILGGLGRESGALLGAATIVLVQDALRIVGLSNAGVSALEGVIYGILLLAILRFRPMGMIGRVMLR